MLCQVVLTNQLGLAGKTIPTCHPAERKRPQVNKTNPSLYQLNYFNIQNTLLLPNHQAPSYWSKENKSGQGYPLLQWVQRWSNAPLPSIRWEPQGSERDGPTSHESVGKPRRSLVPRPVVHHTIRAGAGHGGEGEECSISFLSCLLLHFPKSANSFGVHLLHFLSPFHLENKHVFVATLEGRGSPWASQLLRWQNCMSCKDFLPHLHNAPQTFNSIQDQQYTIYLYPMILKNQALSESGRAYKVWLL